MLSGVQPWLCRKMPRKGPRPSRTSARAKQSRERQVRERVLAARSGGSDFSLPFSLSALADYISADRSAMMRELKKMREEDLLSVHGRDVTLYAGI